MSYDADGRARKSFGLLGVMASSSASLVIMTMIASWTYTIAMKPLTVGYGKCIQTKEDGCVLVTKSICTDAAERLSSGMDIRCRAAQGECTEWCWRSAVLYTLEHFSLCHNGICDWGIGNITNNAVTIIFLAVIVFGAMYIITSIAVAVTWVRRVLGSQQLPTHSSQTPYIQLTN